MSNPTISNWVRNLLKQENIILYKWNDTTYHITCLSNPHEDKIITLHIKGDSVFDGYGFCVGSKEEFNFLNWIMRKEEIKRMIDEFNELIERISKLTYFLSINCSINEETEDKYAQLDAMIDYSKILERRLNRLGIESVNLRDPNWVFNE